MFMTYAILALLIGYVVRSLYRAYESKGIEPLSFSGIRSILAILNIIFICALIFSIPWVLQIKEPDELVGQFMLAGLIIFAFLQFFLITNDTLANILSDFFSKFNLIKLYLFNNFYFETPYCIIELKTENGWKNIYCYENGKLNPKVCLIREIENTEDILLFLSLIYENFSKNNDMNYQIFTDFAKRNGMFMKTYEVIIERGLPFNALLKKNGISTEVKKLNINTAAEEEITNLPFINIVTAKRILKHINEVGQFKSFWEFANFARITPNQGLILSKLVCTKEIPADKNNKAINKDKFDRKVDI